MGSSTPTHPFRSKAHTVCLHHNDPDGRASGMIVRRALGPQIRLHEINYGDIVPWDLLENAQRIVVVDFSLPRQDMIRLAQNCELIWIDHHITAIQDMADVSPAWAGKRSTAEAACVLSWQYYFPDHPVPRGIVLIGDKDIWRMAEAETRPFNEGLLQENTHTENLHLWDAILDDDRALIQRLAGKGQILLQARLNNLHRAARRFGFPVNFEGFHTLVINRPGEGELIEIATQQLGYEVAYCYVDTFQNGKLVTSVMIGSRSVDVSQIARKFGGGGHPGASGFQFERGGLPFPPGANVEISQD